MFGFFKLRFSNYASVIHQKSNCNYCKKSKAIHIETHAYSTSKKLRMENYSLTRTRNSTS